MDGNNLIVCDGCHLALPSATIYKCTHCDMIMCFKCMTSHAKTVIFTDTQVPGYMKKKRVEVH